MKSIRRSLKDRQSPPGSAGSNYSGQYASAHHVLGNGQAAGGGGNTPVTTLPPARGKAQGKTPPKKVIRAVTSYRSRSPQELSFESGDFFHVMGERFDGAGEVEWFDAANPATGARGLVPASCFQVLGRNEKENRAQSMMSAGSGNTLSPPLGQSNQFQPGSSTSSMQSQHQHQQQQHGISPSPSPSSSSFPHNQAKPQQRPRTQPLYGIVQYDFRAERPDELDARRGENIIVIAQSNHEWFVAKPIGRLGGPGLIPVSFVAISDTTTGEPLAAEKVKDMIESGMVPPVEEWKKQTAEYKQASIPLGRFEFSNQSTPTLASSSGQRTSGNSSTPYGLQQGQGNHSATSLGSSQGGGGRPPSNSNKAFSPNSSTSSFNKQSSAQQQYQPQYDDRTPQPPQQPYSNSQFAETSTSSFGNQPAGHAGRQQSGDRSNQHQQHLSHADDYYGSGGQADQQGEDVGEGEDFYDKYGVVTSASVESFHSEEENFWFHLRVNFDQSGYSLILYRLYDDFYEFQCALMDEHPIEAGKSLPPDARPGDIPKRIIPKMPGPVENVDEVVCAQRVVDLTVYLRGLCGLPDYLKADQLFYEFLVPRPGDVEASTPDDTMSARWEAEKQRDRERDRELAHSAHGTRGKKLDEEVEEYLDQMGNATNGMARSNLGSSNPINQAPPPPKPGVLPPLNTSANSNSPFAPGYSMTSSINSNHARQPSQPDRPDSRADSQGAGYNSSNGGPLSAGSGINFTSPFATTGNQQSLNKAIAASATAPQLAPPFVKIKILNRITDDLIAIRVPPTINLSSLLDRVRDRLGGEVNHVRYKDESNQRLSQGQIQTMLSAPGGGRLIELRDDAELDDWMKSAQRLVAYVD